MAIVAGIDEAGYGPVLGPLAVAATAFRVPEGEAQTDLWHLFRNCITRNATRKTCLVRVADSKRVYAGGIGALERTVLPFVGLLHMLPDTLRGFLNALRGAALPELDAYPWHAAEDPALPRTLSREVIDACARLLRLSLAEQGGAFCWARLRLLEAAEFNREVLAADNKAAPLARLLGETMVELWEAFGEEGVWLSVDKQGGRDYYEEFLLANFFGCAIVKHVESAERSEYTLRNGARRMRVCFAPRSDDRHLPVALASMICKYTRELMMERLNGFWAARVPRLRPTAGYLPDGRRFLDDIEPARAAADIPLNLLQRCR